MQIVSPFALSATRPVRADAALPVAQASEMERLALAMLQCAERLEIEAGLVLQITPVLPVEGLAALAGVGEHSTALLLEYLLEAGFVARRRQRFVLAQPEALHCLALGVAPA
jgi:hypothetical protein